MHHPNARSYYFRGYFLLTIAFLRTYLEKILIVYVCMCSGKDKLGDMDVSLIKEGVRHYFQDLFTAKPLDIHHFLGYQMKDLDIVFPKIPHNTL